MLKGYGIPVLVGSIYLVIYGVCLSRDSLYGLACLLFSSYPILLMWIIYAILKPGDYQIRELQGEEFGYNDRQKDQLGIF